MFPCLYSSRVWQSTAKSLQQKVVHFSSRSRGGDGNLGGFPQYSLYGPNCFLQLKVIPTNFRVTPGNYLLTDGANTGTFLLEWVPRGSDGRGMRDSVLRFGLSPEEVGLIVDSIPDEGVVFARDGDESTTTSKVFRLNPVEGRAVEFTIDFEADGIGGYAPPETPGLAGLLPLSVTAQRGEVVVVRELLRHNIPKLVNWDMMWDLQMQNKVAMATNKNKSGGGGSSNNDGYNVPF